MTGWLRRCFFAIVFGILAGAVPASEGNNNDSSMPRGGSAAGLSSATTRAVVRILERGNRECGNFRKEYRFDCFRVAYKLAADGLAGIPAYREAFQALAAVQKVLEQQVARNADPSAKPVRRGLQTYKAVKPSAVPAVERATTRAMQEAETVLLRSGDKKAVHYAKIAEAVNSNKVLLRSALLLLPGGRILAALWLEAG